MFKSNVSYIALEQLELSVQYSDALEAYTFIHRILDVFGRMLYNLKAHLVGLMKQFKRSELRFYHESKTLGVANLNKKKYFDGNLSVPIPSGMKIPYIQAVDIIDELFKKLDIHTSLDTLLVYLEKQPLNDPSVITKEINKLTKNELEGELRKVFSSEKTLEVPLHTVISDFTELKEIDTKILNFESMYNQIEIVCEKLGRIETIIDKIVSDLETQKENINYKFVQSFQVLVRSTAFQIDACGVICTEGSRIEHNFVILLNKLVEEAAKSRW